MSARGGTATSRAGFAPGAAAMAAAAQALDDVVCDGGCTAEEALARLDIPLPDRAAVRAIHSGTLRWYLRLAPAVDALLTPGQQMQPLVRAVLVTALHQIEYSRAAGASVVNIAVDAVRALGQARASGFVNALLRRWMTEREAVLARIDASEAARVAHPRWLLRAVRAAWPAGAESIFDANNEQPPMTLRANLSRSTREDCLALLAAEGIGAQPGAVETAIVLDAPRDVAQLPGFADGLLSVQDAGAQQAALLLDARPGERVLDACAAPGGKTGHILERCNGNLDLLAIDSDAQRLARVAQNLERIGHTATLVAADLLADGWWDGRPFDRILLDAPCSGTGVIRRHPDIKLLRRAEDIAGFAALQLRLLTRCAALLKPGGRLVYATCSILPEENSGVADRFLQEHTGMHRERPYLALPPRSAAAGAATLTDGFHYACLMKGGEAA